MTMTAIEPKTPKSDRPAHMIRGPVVLALACWLSAGCRHSERGERAANAKNEAGKTAGIRVVHPEKRDIRMTVTQPGTIQAFEVAPMFSRVAGYVAKYNFNIGDRVKAGDVLLEMWIPDLVEQLGQKSAAVKRAQVQIRVVQAHSSPPKPRSRRPGHAFCPRKPGSNEPRPAMTGGIRSTSGL